MKRLPKQLQAAIDAHRRSDFDTAAIRSDLDWTPRPFEDTVRDTADSLVAHGVV